MPNHTVPCQYLQVANRDAAPPHPKNHFEPRRDIQIRTRDAARYNAFAPFVPVIQLRNSREIVDNFRSIPSSFSFHVITKQHILIANIKLAVGDHGMGPGVFVAAIGRIKVAVVFEPID